MYKIRRKKKKKERKSQKLVCKRLKKVAKRLRLNSLIRAKTEIKIFEKK